jgi:hypothetical protein
MVAPLIIAGGITVEGGVKAGAFNAYEGVSTIVYQNVAGSAGSIGFFFINGGAGWADLGSQPNLNQVAAGWLVNGNSSWVVVSTDSPSQTVTSNGFADFVPGSFYSFTSN